MPALICFVISEESPVNGSVCITHLSQVDDQVFPFLFLRFSFFLAFLFFSFFFGFFAFWLFGSTEASFRYLFQRRRRRILTPSNKLASRLSVCACVWREKKGKDIDKIEPKGRQSNRGFKKTNKQTNSQNKTKANLQSFSFDFDAIKFVGAQITVFICQRERRRFFIDAIETVPVLNFCCCCCCLLFDLAMVSFQTIQSYRDFETTTIVNQKKKSK